MVKIGSTSLAAGAAALLILLPTFSGAVAGAPPETLREDLEVERLADGVWLHTSYEELEGFGRVPANGLVVVSDGEVPAFTSK